MSAHQTDNQPDSQPDNEDASRDDNNGILVQVMLPGKLWLGIDSNGVKVCIGNGKGETQTRLTHSEFDRLTSLPLCGIRDALRHDRRIRGGQLLQQYEREYDSLQRYAQVPEIARRQRPVTDHPDAIPMDNQGDPVPADE